MRHRMTQDELFKIKFLRDKVKEGLDDFDIEIKVPDYLVNSLNPSMPLRPYQIECFKIFIGYLEHYKKKKFPMDLLFNMATGSGKTLIMAGLIIYLFKQGYRNFLFFVDSVNILGKTKENFFNKVSPKYQFAPKIIIDGREILIRHVENFQDSDDSCINICLDTTQGLYLNSKEPRENTLTMDDFAENDIVFISDESHHLNSATKKKGKINKNDPNQTALNLQDDWETQIYKLFEAGKDNGVKHIMLQFTATIDWNDINIRNKYCGITIYQYDLKRFREDGYSKEIEVIQCGFLSTVERAILGIVMNQFKRKLFERHRYAITPRILFKSKTIKDNVILYNDFCDYLKNMTVDMLSKIIAVESGDIQALKSYLEVSKIDLDNLLLELKTDFSEEKLLLLDGKNIPEDYQIKLNSLEDPNNEIRGVFAVDMLNEGWDVKNLYDIVRMYDTRDSKNNIPGKTTIAEAQLIGRGARYMPFHDSNTNTEDDKRKYDNDISNPLRLLETLHYYSAYNPPYITELKSSLIKSGIMPEIYRKIEEKLKDSIKKSDFFQTACIYKNTRTANRRLEVKQLNAKVLSKVYFVGIFRDNNNRIINSQIMESEEDERNFQSSNSAIFKLKDFGNNVIRYSLNAIPQYNYSNLKIFFPHLKSIKEFIVGEQYLSNVKAAILNCDDINSLSQSEKYSAMKTILQKVWADILKEDVSYIGSKNFLPYPIKDIIKDHTLKITSNNLSGYGVSISKEPLEIGEKTIFLSECNWHAYEDCFGTAEEKSFVKYFHDIYNELSKKYIDIYLFRNEHDFAIYSIKNGNTFEPDYVLFMRQKQDKKSGFITLQVFIEPKGEHIATSKEESWKEDFLVSIKEEAILLNNGKDYNLWGMPFFNKTTDRIKRFDAKFRKSFLE